jgi:hypothetical protein
MSMRNPMKDEVEAPIEQNGKREIEKIIKQIPLNCYPGTMIGVEKESLRIGLIPSLHLT